MALKERSADDLRIYDRSSCVVFLKTKEAFGGLSNMASGFPLCVNGLSIRTSEALYQACRFPHLPDLQRLILDEKSPMTAKMRTKPHRDNSRPDWEQVRVKIMRWCLRIKLAQNWQAFGDLLLSTGEKPIVEESYKDDFWGAKPTDPRTLVGHNVLGRLLMELRRDLQIRPSHELLSVAPLPFPDFLFDGRPIEPVSAGTPASPDVAAEKNPNLWNLWNMRGLGEDFFPQADLHPQPTTATSEDAAGWKLQATESLMPTTSDSALQAELPPPTPPEAGGIPSAHLQPYPAYKDSGLPWLGQVPEHWDTRRVRHICDMRVSNVDKHTRQGEIPVRLCNYVDVYKNDRIRQTTRFMKATASEGERTRFALRIGDVLITKDSEQWNDIGVPALVEYEANDLVCGYHLALLRPRPGLLGSFLFRTLESHWIAPQFYVEANGVTRYGLSHGAIQGVAIPLPPPEEQAAIVRFLDHNCARLDKAIRLKRKLVALLHEQKQAIIHQAVTRGLDKDAPLKPSGIPWLGDIPEYWEVRRLGHLARVGNGSTPLRGNPKFWDGGTVPWLNSSQVNRDYIDSADQFVTGLALQKCHLPQVPAGSILVAITGQGKTRGMSSLLGIEATINQHIAYITPRSQVVSSPFIRLTLSAAYFHLRAISDDSGSTKGAITCEELKRFKVPLPPLEEQGQILQQAHFETKETISTIARLEREIELLREYRTRLIADVVTGKLDVREAAANLPDEAPQDAMEEDSEPMEEAEATHTEQEEDTA